jgi:hypothetical protein
VFKKINIIQQFIKSFFKCGRQASETTMEFMPTIGGAWGFSHYKKYADL